MWQQVTSDYAFSLAEERLSIARELFSLTIRKNDYFAYLRKFCQLKNRHAELAFDLDDVYHDIFIIGLGNCQYSFMKTKLDEFYAPGQTDITNLDIKALTDQLSARVQKNVPNEADLPHRAKPKPTPRPRPTPRFPLLRRARAARIVEGPTLVVPVGWMSLHEPLESDCN